jgi:two-component system, response regulator PdtaR
MRVLIVEDEPLIAMHIEMMVKDFGYHVCGVATSTREAISLAATEHPHIALMDIHLAGSSSGIEAAQELFQSHGVRCIFLSANLDRHVREAVAPFKPIGFLGKPVLPVLLRRALAQAENSI